MTRTIITFTLFLCTLLASAQDRYQDGMNKAFALWGEGKSKEASDLFERIASAEKNNWLPAYYVAMVNATASFQTKDKDVISALLAKAQEALDQAYMVSTENAELNVMQALIYTAWIVYDPMTNGMKYSGLVMQEYEKAEKLAPNNPRVVFGKAEFEIGGAKYFGQDTTPMCQQIDRAIGLFATFKSDVPFYPQWGLDRAKEAQAQCAKK
ncbi:MAG TPA: hypothetical protein VK183_00140 [Flavobacterium sp.]|nr:hypothetical protein [Flavobacterium sp.]